MQSNSRLGSVISQSLKDQMAVRAIHVLNKLGKIQNIKKHTGAVCFLNYLQI